MAGAVLPKESNTVEAGCFIDGVPLTGIVERIDICRNTEHSYSISFVPWSGVGTFHASCGYAGAHSTNTVNGVTFPDSSQPLTGNYTLATFVPNVNQTVTVGFRVFAYLGETQDAPRKVHSSLSFTPGSFTYDGECMQVFP
jgi:hypothetical protein